MAIHVVILKPAYLRAVLDGRKTIECRLSKTQVPPYDRVAAGERLFLKYSGGPFAATCLAGRVETFADLTPDRIDALHQRYNDAVRDDGGYWQGKRDSRFATLVHLTAVEPIDVGPPYAKSPYRGWFVLDEATSPLRDIPLTAGALRNRYLPAVEASDTIRGGSIRLELPDGETVDTHLTERGRMHWRGWGPYYRAWGLEAGDVVRLLAIGTRHYRVTFHARRGSESSIAETR
jgi:hypothetical protein